MSIPVLFEIRLHFALPFLGRAVHVLGKVPAQAEPRIVLWEAWLRTNKTKRQTESHSPPRRKNWRRQKSAEVKQGLHCPLRPPTQLAEGVEFPEKNASHTIISAVSWRRGGRWLGCFSSIQQDFEPMSDFFPKPMARKPLIDCVALAHTLKVSSWTVRFQKVVLSLNGRFCSKRKWAVPGTRVWMCKTRKRNAIY